MTDETPLRAASIEMTLCRDPTMEEVVVGDVVTIESPDRVWAKRGRVTNVSSYPDCEGGTAWFVELEGHVAGACIGCSGGDLVLTEVWQTGPRE